MADVAGSRDELRALWDREIVEWLSGMREVSDELRPWFECYRGKGERGAANLKAFPEPFLGPLFGKPKAAFLALNPGPVYPDFQYDEGVFAKELRQEPYTEWARRWRYLDPTKPRVEGGLRFHGKRLNFLRRWHSDETIDGNDMLAFELYPWHSEELNAPFVFNEKAQGLIRRFVWGPIAEAGAEWIFAVGAGFEKVFVSLGLPVLGILGEGGEQVGFQKRRRILVTQPTPTVIALAMNNFNRPAAPNPHDSRILRDALSERGWVPS